VKTYAEIKRILVDELGFSRLEDYKRWIDETRPKIAPTTDRIDRLSPDNVDCRDFWRVCDELFGADPVCNVAITPAVGKLPHPIESDMDANRTNLRLAKSLGITFFLDENANSRLKTLEIGPGYGSLKHYIETHTQHLYTGVDVFPRIPGLVQATAQGTLPQSMIEQERGEYSYVVSSNVFQHLSARQRSTYFRDVHVLLHDGGIFLFNLHVDTGKFPAHMRDAQGNAWCDHYAQYTLIPKPRPLHDELSSLFEILYLTQRYDSLFNFVCQKRRSS
jgi:hypothetical protein